VCAALVDEHQPARPPSTPSRGQRLAGIPAGRLAIACDIDAGDTRSPAGRDERRHVPFQRGVGRGGQPIGQPGVQLPPPRLRPVPLFGRGQAAARPPASQMPLQKP
jgi:hypothetical protein